MCKKCAFSICSKNYLSQAFTLRESFIKYNPGIDFHIFLADEYDAKLLDEYKFIIQLSNEIVPGWEDMAFKYDVIEFNTSIKPFCIDYLLKKYERVIYLDPDIYVVSSLDTIYEMLNDKDFVITPHFNHIEINFTGSVSEEELLFVGIYNLGFCAIKNSEVGEQIISWWKKRLQHKCFADKDSALHVDQKWIDFLPAAYPNNVLICQHPGINMAIWNLHERILETENNPYYVKDTVTKQSFPLLFFHFSGFDPFNKNVLNRRHPQFNISDYPVYKNIINEYATEVYKNGYEFFSKQIYGFNQFDNGIRILPVNRRIYNSWSIDNYYENLFSADGVLYKECKKKKLLSKAKNSKVAILKVDTNVKSKKYTQLNKIMKIVFKILGIDRYDAFLRALNRISQKNYQSNIIG